MADDDRPWRAEDELRRLYCEEGLTMEQLADRWDCSTSTVGRWILYHDLNPGRAPSGEAPWRDSEELRRLYYDEGLTKVEIADRLGCSLTSVTDWMRRHDLAPGVARSSADRALMMADPDDIGGRA